LKRLFSDWQNRTLIKSGNPDNVGVLEAERLRIVRRLQNLGYFSVSRNNIEFFIDSSLNTHLMDITAVINPPRTGGNSEAYTFSDIHIFPDERPGRTEHPFDTTTFRVPRSRKDTAMSNYYFIHTKPLQIKPHVIVSKLMIHQGNPYSLTAVDRTYENLLDLRVFRSTNIAVSPLPIDSNNPQFLLNTTIELQQAPVIVWNNDFEITSASDLTGTVFHSSLQHRNLFGGAEIFSLRLRGQLEVQYLLDKAARESDLVDNYDIGISANLDIPRFIAPFSLSQTNVHRPRTLISAGYSYRDRFRYYSRYLTNLSFGYSWRSPRVSHTLFPLDINLVSISLTDSFAKRIEELSETNKRLEYQYADHFIFAARYGFSFSGQQGNRSINFNAFRFSVETSGNMLHLLSNALNAPKYGEAQQYEFFNLPYAQYIRTDADFRRYWFLTDRQILVTRMMGGIGFVYGNSKVLPYEKGFFAGGNSNIRAWPMNQLGPGSYINPNPFNIERIGDIVLVGNVEYRFPIAGALKGALFTDVGNIWVRNDNGLYPNGEFAWKNVPNDLAIGGGLGLRWDLNFLVIRLDAAAPLRNPAKPDNEKWVIGDTRWKDFVLNFGIGYPF
ncbi:MAG: BamA/TamA family outer membrane protein, partial [Bacteroidales bacterium]|jgi:outer membrane protein assembly factor BamA|nr:BamA/TamA family outer membrane protein [Bacteroidales bacterium]